MRKFPLYKKISVGLPGFLIVIGLLAGCQSSPDIGSEALNLLQKVESRYSSLDSYRIKATIITEMEGGRRNRTIEIPLSYSASKPGKMRLEVQHKRAPVTMVSDGSVTWTYNAATNRFSSTKASILQSGTPSESTGLTDRQFMQLARSLTDPYTRITEKLTSARIVRQPRLEVNGKTMDTYLVETTYEQELESRRPDAGIAPTRYWISTNHHLVLKQKDAYTLPSPQSGDSVRVRETTRLTDFDLNPTFTSKSFTFEKPEDAKQVDQIKIGGPAGSSSMEGRQAPSFSLTDLSGEKNSLGEFKDKVVLLDFWATWCAPCRRAHPDIQELYDQYKDDGLVVLGINNEGRKTARDYMQKHSYTFTTLLDTTNTVAGRYGVSAMPYYFVINRNGKITSEIIGYHPKSDMLKALEEAGLTTE